MSLDLYEKTRVVGKGSYGEVWLVKHKKDSKSYVLKRMDLQNASKRERKAAEQEAKLLSRLKHPNIVSYKDSFEAPDGYLYIAMGFCEGGDLYTRLKQQKGTALEERQVVEWFVQIAMALQVLVDDCVFYVRYIGFVRGLVFQYMHERNILHRDLKTQNIFLTKSKIIKLGDLGIARVLESSEDMASTLIGTPYYMSPELFSNKPYNHKSDVWALGCCVYEMATLKHAFNAKDMNSLVYKILRGKMPMMPKIYSTELVELIRIMLNQDPDKRPSVNRILRNQFIKKNIAIFLEGTRSRKPSLAGRPSSGGVRPESGNRPVSGESRRRVSRDQPDSHDTEGIEESKLGRKSHRSKDADSVSVASVDGESTSRSAIFDNPKPVDKPRPLPPPPSSGTPVKKKSAGRRTSNEDSGISTSTSVNSSLDTQQDGETPRSRNLSARARRREKKQLEGATEGSVTPTVEPVLSKHPIHKSRSAAAQLDEADGIGHGRWERGKAEEFNSKQPHRQPSQDDGESSSDTENSQDVDKKLPKQKASIAKSKPNRSEMSNFISLLDTTLKMDNKTDDYLSDDEFDVADGGDARPPRVPKTDHPALHRIHSEPAVGAQTLSSSGRLMDRIAVLRKDCIRGLGIPKLHKAYEILDNIDGDELEPRLLELLGKDDFDTYAGKIWQLKFCEESAFGLK